MIDASRWKLKRGDRRPATWGQAETGAGTALAGEAQVMGRDPGNIKQTGLSDLLEVYRPVW
ncbi:hypothetical protein GCM10009097_40300 [Pigmentiphaga daeguensis]|uniref:Transposase n=1 Tax=Pigmentiphaga daeguensis TaxID=414049 RepID=A0ABN1CI58_9BURK